MSPARTIAPAIAFGMYSYLVAPLMGTILGGLGAGMAYSYLYLFKAEEVPDAYVPCHSNIPSASHIQRANAEACLVSVSLLV